MDDLLDRVWAKIEKAVVERQNPFRVMVLATSDHSGSVSQRSVVLRATERDHSIVFYTDERSDKLRVIKENDLVSLLFYDPNERIQVTCKGNAQILSVDGSDISNYKLRSTKDYMTMLPPGSLISSPKDVRYNQDNVHFAKVTVVLSDIDYLKLDKECHVRASFKRIKNQWIGQYLVP